MHIYVQEDHLNIYGGVGFENCKKEHIILNMDKKKILEPGKRTWTGASDIGALAFTHPETGNPFQYLFFQQLMNDWKGDRVTIIEDSQDVRDYLVQQEGYGYFREYGKKLRQEVYEDDDVRLVSYDRTELRRWKKQWDKFMGKYILINYDNHLFMTIDRRLFKRTQNLMPYFVLAKAEEKSECMGSWAGNRIGIEPIDSPTVADGTYIEMFRMIGDKSVCQLLVEEWEQRLKGAGG